MSGGELTKRIHEAIRKYNGASSEIDFVILEAAKDILRPVMEKEFDNTGRAYMMPDGIDIVLDTRNAERKLALIVRSIFKWFGDVKTSP